MKSLAKIMISMLIILNLNILLHAESTGETGMNFLKIPTDIRGMGMGESGTGLSDNIGSIYWNVAGLAGIDTIDMQFMYNKWFEDISSQYFAVAMPIRKGTKAGNFKRYGTFGININYLSMDPIQGYDNNGAKTNDLNSHDIAFGLSYAGNIYKESVSLGGTVKYLSEKLADTSADAYALDLGLLVRVKREISFGVSASNIGTKVKFIDESGELPRMIRAGGSYVGRILGQNFTMSCDAVMPNDNDTYVAGGAEYWIKNIIAVRAGYKTGVDEGSGIRAGFAIKTNMMQFDYAFAGFGDLGDTHRIGISIRFSQAAYTEDSAYEKADMYYKEGRYSAAVDELNVLLQKEPHNKKAIMLLNRCYKNLEVEVGSSENKETKFKDGMINMGMTK